MEPFDKTANATLENLLERIEAADTQGVLDAELEAGALSVALPNGKQYLITKHAPSAQLWLASPMSGGLHFSPRGDEWVLADGRTLDATVRAELCQLAGVDIGKK
jgi:iron donor protein CyaY